MRKRKLLLVTNVDWFLISHRLVIVEAAIKAGWSVYVACEDTGRSAEITSTGASFVDFSFSRSGTNVMGETKLLLSFFRLYKTVRPDVVHHITIKPVVYGSIAAKVLRIKGVVNAISGLGYMFTDGKIGTMQKIILKLMRYGARRGNVQFIFQNLDDYLVLKNANVLDDRNTTNLIKGSGVNLIDFKFEPLSASDKVTIMLPCRMLWDKGVKELKEASELLRDKYYSRIRFILVGMADNNNKSGVPEQYLRHWEDGSYVQWLGHQSDMKSYYKSSHIVVLPSYREGLPKTLIEACAIGRAIITTDAIGCKDCVDEGINGFKVPVGDSRQLASAIARLVDAEGLMEKMGIAGREKAVAEFDVQTVIDRHLSIYRSVLS